MNLPLSFEAKVVTGSGRGKDLGSPTLNLELSDIPDELLEGVYAAALVIEDTMVAAAMHYGPRPTFKDEKSCELHVIGTQIDYPPTHLHVRVLKKLRDVRFFENTDVLKKQIAADTEQTTQTFLSYNA
jgi:riboflavin kinase/FMN adenylyltransferase